MFIYPNLVYFFFIIYIQHYSKLFYIKYHKLSIYRTGNLQLIIKNNTTTQAHTTRFPFFLHPLPFLVSSQFFLFSLYTIVLIVKNFLSKIISEHLGPFAQSLSHRSGSLGALVLSSCPSSNGRLRRFSQMWRYVLMVRLASLCACDRIWSDRLLCNFFFFVQIFSFVVLI